MFTPIKKLARYLDTELRKVENDLTALFGRFRTSRGEAVVANAQPQLPLPLPAISSPWSSSRGSPVSNIIEPPPSYADCISQDSASHRLSQSFCSSSSQVSVQVDGDFVPPHVVPQEIRYNADGERVIVDPNASTSDYTPTPPRPNRSLPPSAGFEVQEPLAVTPMRTRFDTPTSSNGEEIGSPVAQAAPRPPLIAVVPAAAHPIANKEIVFEPFDRYADFLDEAIEISTPNEAYSTSWGISQKVDAAIFAAPAGVEEYAKLPEEPNTPRLTRWEADQASKKTKKMIDQVFDAIIYEHDGLARAVATQSPRADERARAKSLIALKHLRIGSHDAIFPLVLTHKVQAYESFWRYEPTDHWYENQMTRDFYGIKGAAQFIMDVAKECSEVRTWQATPDEIKVNAIDKIIIDNVNKIVAEVPDGTSEHRVRGRRAIIALAYKMGMFYNHVAMCTAYPDIPKQTRVDAYSAYVVYQHLINVLSKMYPDSIPRQSMIDEFFRVVKQPEVNDVI